jgi:hypothetical protein
MSQHFTQDELRDIIDRCINEGRNLSDWEKDQFLPSISEQLDRVGHLSEKQQEILDRIYTEKVS